MPCRDSFELLCKSGICITKQLGYHAANIITNCNDIFKFEHAVISCENNAVNCCSFCAQGALFVQSVQC